MKKKLIMLIFAIMLMCPVFTAYAETEPAFYDFSDYVTPKSNPKGWASSNLWELSPEKVDDAHGTSLGVLYKGIPAYKFAETVSGGQFIISFEIYLKDFDQRLRLHVTSPDSGKDDHTVLVFEKGEVKSASTGSGAWDFAKMKELETDRWYQVDMLFDMDEGVLYYYVDGTEYATKKIAFANMSKITFRTESGTDKAKLYLDNVSFKYKNAGGFDTVKRVMEVGETEIKLSFEDVYDAETISGIEIYSMGNDPFSYSSEKLDAEVVKTGVKTVSLMLERPVEKSTVYKVYANGVKTLFGDELTNNTVYFASGGTVADRVAIDGDFSTVENVGNRKPVLPASDIQWTTGGYGRIYPYYTDDLGENEIAVVNFHQHKGSSAYPDNFGTLTRDIDVPYTGEFKAEFKIKAKLGLQSFKVLNSEKTPFEIFGIDNDRIMVNGEKVASINADTWYVFTVIFNTENETAKISIDGGEIAVAECDGLDAVSGVVFEQKNSETTYGTDTEQGNCANMMIAYFRLFAKEECTSLILVNFEDAYGNVHYPEGDIPTEIVKVNMIFSKGLNESTLKNGISFTQSGAQAGDGYEYKNGVYSIFIPDYLNGNSSYEISVAETVKDENNKSVLGQSGKVSTDGGIFEGRKFDFKEDGNGYRIDAEVVHTDGSCRDVYVAYAAYKGNLMIDYKLVPISTSTDYRKIEFSDVYEKSEEADKVYAFLWDGFDFMNPILRAQIIE